MKDLYMLIRVEGNPSMAYHLQMDGQMEWVNWEVEKYLCMYMTHHQTDWADWLPLVEFTYNNTIHKAMGFSPFFLNKGRHPRAFPTNNNTPGPLLNEAAKTFVEELTKVRKAADKALEKVKVSMKRRWDETRIPRPPFSSGDRVLISSDHLPSMRESRKLDDKWRGPFMVVEVVGKAAPPPAWKGHPVFNELRLRPFQELAFPIQQTQPDRPEPILQDQVPKYKVERVLDSHEKVYYLACWKGYSSEDDTWEPAANLANAPKALQDFEGQG
jgi:hypothetical protein